MPLETLTLEMRAGDVRAALLRVRREMEFQISNYDASKYRFEGSGVDFSRCQMYNSWHSQRDKLSNIVTKLDNYEYMLSPMVERASRAPNKVSLTIADLRFLDLIEPGSYRAHYERHFFRIDAVMDRQREDIAAQAKLRADRAAASEI